MSLKIETSDYFNIVLHKYNSFLNGNKNNQLQKKKVTFTQFDLKV